MILFAFDPASMFLLFLIIVGVPLAMIVIYFLVGMAESNREQFLESKEEDHPPHNRVEGETPESEFSGEEV